MPRRFVARSALHPTWQAPMGIVALLALVSTPTLGAPSEAAPPSAPDAATVHGLDPSSPTFARDVLRISDDLYRGAQSHGVMAMRVKTEHWTRTLALETWSLGTQYSLLRILAPMKEKGTATLKAKDDLFTYLNKTERTIKITGGMMGASWMGSHFTNDDLVQETRMSDDYDIVKTTEGTVTSQPAYTFELVPKPDAPVVWGKVVISIRKTDFLPIEQVFYDEDGEAVRKLEFADLRTVGGRVLPTRMRMTPLDSPGEFTEITYKTLDFDVKLERSFFSLQNLKRM